MVPSASTTPPERARRGSVLDLAAQRQRVATALLVLIPISTLCWLPGLAVALLCGLAVGALFVTDVVACVRAGREWRRMAQGQGPAHAGVDYGVGPDWSHVAPPADPYRAVDRVEYLSRGSPLAAKAVIQRNLVRRGLRMVACAVASALVVAFLWPGVRLPDDRFNASVAKQQLVLIHSAASPSRGDQPCPTPESLRVRGRLPHDFPTSDPWGTPYALECHGYEQKVTSAGPDRIMGTADDITVPPTY
jgi:hypothetical protein